MMERLGVREAWLRPIGHTAGNARRQAIGLFSPRHHLRNRAADLDDQRDLRWVQVLRKQALDVSGVAQAVFPNNGVERPCIGGDSVRPIQLEHLNHEVCPGMGWTKHVHFRKSLSGPVRCRSCAQEHGPIVHNIETAPQGAQIRPPPKRRSAHAIVHGELSMNSGVAKLKSLRGCEQQRQGQERQRNSSAAANDRRHVNSAHQR
mmetsp:Transcript_118105/g.252388  ORF Transcript_118105/g.252388 Transcript_118105/m.252388 type:complete len:204 (-) Transcript_118105:66-677(-)